VRRYWRHQRRDYPRPDAAQRRAVLRIDLPSSSGAMTLGEWQRQSCPRDDRLCRSPEAGAILDPRAQSAIERHGRAFVGTFKRDCVFVHDRPDAQTVLSQLSAWFEDYDASHPHKALPMNSLREFIRSYQPATCPVCRGQLQQAIVRRQEWLDSTLLLQCSSMKNSDHSSRRTPADPSCAQKSTSRRPAIALPRPK
jgi:hypothetical protein